ncbi:hypothetical protein UP10_23545 [Bradyrhizobium sp. LTSPM299]|jgi:HEAT repeat protein|uniref:HEAT repeat domain-containing protein n=1 Tax=Bradyrhizobium sp. LTSPM299 TaxID=1619233 RepID=UPI0005C9C269|nr:hypothetical protein [Bradyrhizobium sp. LTSPM299]KJC57991.1 hypothetical protein UP10_23545 [Bradyrhizobium sp. LTSPM299]
MTHEAIRSLVSRNDPEALGELGTLSVAGDEFVRRTAVEVIGKHPRGRELHKAILAALGDRSAYVRRTALDVVAQWKWVEAHTFVSPLLKEPAASTRECALRALAAIWTEADFAPVFDIYQQEEPRSGQNSVNRPGSSPFRPA